MIHHAALAALLMAQAAPPAAEPACITPQQAGDLAVSMLPYVVDAAARHCRPHLAADAFLATGGQTWLERLRRDAAPRRASALSGIQMVGGSAPPPGVEPAAAFDLFAQMISLGLTAGIRPESCTQVDTIARSLEPLPSENIANLVAAALTMASAYANVEDDDRDEDSDPDEDSAETAPGEGDVTDAEDEAAPARRGPPICPA